MVYIKSCKGLYKNEKTKMPASDLVLEPVKEVIKGMDALDIDGIICATITKDYIYPSASCMLGGKIKAKNAFCYDIESDFTGFISALRLAYSFVESKRYKNVLAISSESFYICDDKDRFNDASVAALITSEKSNIQIDGYENVNFKDNFFDIAIGNVPFGEFKLYDERYKKYNFLIHDYFFVKTLDKVKPRRNYSIYYIKGNIG